MERLARTLYKPRTSTQHILCICLICLSVQVVLGLDQVILLDPPLEAHPDSLLDVFYSCSGHATVQLDLIVFFDTGRIRAFRLNHWHCDPNGPSLKILRLNLPDWLVYRADGIVPDSQWVLSCMLEVAVTYPHIFSDAEELVAGNDVAYLEPVPYFERPVKSHQLCIAWDMLMLKLNPHLLQKQCPLEQETVPLLSSMFASTGENFGVIKTLKRFNNKALEFLRFKAISSPRCMFSIWILVTRYCTGRLCGLFRHVDFNNNHISPSVFLTNSGQPYIQMSGLDKATAFALPFRVHLRQWCHISVMVHGSRVSGLLLKDITTLPDLLERFYTSKGQSSASQCDHSLDTVHNGAQSLFTNLRSLTHHCFLGM
ncbi:protein sel-1 homolog 3-like [Halichoeres trimaculatus]|uniref:protein sel-1 homolog 3-like n=1 Tax=Halichoeres trimaculatus TaxID=147232 RepID=UPI003D9E6DF1